MIDRTDKTKKNKILYRSSLNGIPKREEQKAWTLIHKDSKVHGPRKFSESRIKFMTVKSSGVS